MKVGIFKDIFEPYNFEDFEKNPWYKKHMFLIDEIIYEPVGGAHRDRDLILDNVRKSIKKNCRGNY